MNKLIVTSSFFIAITPFYTKKRFTFLQCYLAVLSLIAGCCSMIYWNTGDLNNMSSDLLKKDRICARFTSINYVIIALLFSDRKCKVINRSGLTLILYSLSRLLYMKKYKYYYYMHLLYHVSVCLGERYTLKCLNK